MALSNSGNTQLAPRAIAEMAWLRLYDTFPMSYISRATGPRGMIYPYATSATTGTIATAAEAATTSTSAFDPTFGLKSSDLATYRARITVSNELLADSAVYPFIAQRLAGQIAETVAAKIVTDIRTALVTASRYTEADHFDIGKIGTGNTSGISDHSGFKCWANLSNTYRQRACWIFSPSGAENWGTQEGRNTLSTLGVRQEDYLYRRLIGETNTPSAALSNAIGQFSGAYDSGEITSPGEGGTPDWAVGAPAEEGGGAGEMELSSPVKLEKRSMLTAASPTNDQWHTAYLGCPIHTSTGMAAVHNEEGGAWAMLVDLTAWLHFDQPLTVKLDSESLMSNNQTVIHAAYRAAGSFMESTAGWALVSPGA